MEELIEKLAVELANVELGSSCANLTQEERVVWYRLCLDPCCRNRLRNRAVELLALVDEHRMSEEVAVV